MYGYQLRIIEELYPYNITIGKRGGDHENSPDMRRGSDPRRARAGREALLRARMHRRGRGPSGEGPARGPRRPDGVGDGAPVDVRPRPAGDDPLRLGLPPARRG